jgi:hypothetical protein
MPNQFSVAFADLISVQTEVLGSAVLATVGAVATNKPALLSSVDKTDVLIEGGETDRGGFLLQMLTADFTSAPEEGDPVTCNGSAQGKALEVISFEEKNSGIYEITAGSFANPDNE